MNLRNWLLGILTVFQTSILSGASSDDIGSWESVKRDAIVEMAAIPGWCSEEKAHLMMDHIREKKCLVCVEIGVFGGKSMLPILKSLKYNGQGNLYAIDAWSGLEATKGYPTSDPNYSWWNNLDWDHFYTQTLSLVTKHRLHQFCNVLRTSSQDAVNYFADDTIDFIHLDGNHTEDLAFEDVIAYFPKVKDGGYLLLSDPNWYAMRRVLAYLLERAEIAAPFDSGSEYLLVRKSRQKIENAKQLLKE